MSLRWRRIRSSPPGIARPRFAFPRVVAGTSFSSALTWAIAGFPASFLSKSTTAAAGITNERVRSARAMVIPNTRPCRSTTGPPTWFGLGRMSVWITWVNESRTWLTGPPMRSICSSRPLAYCGSWGRFPTVTSILLSPPFASTSRETFAPGATPVSAFFNSNRPEIGRSPTFKITFPGFNPAACAPDFASTSLIFTPWPVKPGSPITPR